MKYNGEALNKVCEELKVTMEVLLKKSENLVIYTVMDLFSETGNVVGRIMKEHPDCEFKLGELVYSESGRCSGNLFKCCSSEPGHVKKYVPVKIESKITNEKSNGRISETGYEYFYESLTNLIKDDPPEMMQALNFVRMLVKRTNLSLALKISSKHYGINHELLASRNGSRVAFWKYAKRK